MKQLDLFEKQMSWPNDFDGAHQVGGVGYGTSDSSYGAVPPVQAGICRAAPDGYNIIVDPPKKIYESPDKGKTVYERNFGETERRLIKSAVQQQWKITFNGEPV